MKKTTNDRLRKDERKKPVPAKDWQIGEFERHANLELIIPEEVLMICRLLDLTPKALVEEFLDDLSKGYSVTGESESNHLSEYFLRKDFGEIKFSVENIWLMLVELNAIHGLWPKGANTEFMEFHSQWRSKYLQYWFQKWKREA